MDKNMIKIDDLFRQRLGGGEEEDRAGAWLNMRELLDEKMPVGMVNWRRMFMYAAGLLLLASLSIGGYEISSSSRRIADGNLNISSNTDNSSAITRNAGNILSNDPDAAKQNNTSSNTATPVVNNTTGNTTSDLTTTKDQSANSTPASVTTGNSNKVATNTKTVTNQVKKSVDNSAKIDNNIASNNKTQNDVNHSVTKNNKQKNSDDENQKTNNNSAGNNNTYASAGITGGIHHNSKHNNIKNSNDPVIASNTQPQGDNITDTKTTKHVHIKPTIDITTGNNPVKRSVGHKAIQPASGTTTIAKAPGTKNAKGNNGIDNLNRVLPKDSIQKLVIVENIAIDPATHMARITADTVDVSKLPVYAMADNKDTRSTDNMQGLGTPSSKQTNNNDNTPIIPGAKSGDAGSSSGGDANNLHAHKGKRTAFDWSALGEKIHDFEYQLGRVRIYPGLIGGVNTSYFMPAGNSGFHFGLTTEFYLSDRASIMAEFKYMERIGGGRLNDNYMQNIPLDSTNTTPKYYTIQQSQVNHYFNYTTMNSIEMPITFRYKAGKFFIYAGGNLVYNFSMNVTEYDTHQTIGNPETHTYPAGYNWRAVDKINVTDFNSRFGLGYVLGLSYEFTPSVMVDGRLTQTFWDNAKTQGATEVSNILYRLPSAQLSIIYRLNHKKPETVIPRY
jgi:hypothetical protein